MSPAARRDPAAFALLCGLSAVVSWWFWQPPRLGDDLDYWSLAMNLRMGVPGAWDSDSFHDLRWPVWGLCWLLMGPLGVSAASYFLQPLVYLAAGACLVFWIAGRTGLGFWGRFAAGVLFLFHPLVDPALSRPMPDLSEGFWVASSFALWLVAVSRPSGVPKALLCAAVGLALAVAQANRVTGVFAIPVLVVCTLVFVPRQLPWLVLMGIFAAGFVLIEWGIYRALTGDLLTSLHANLGARGRKGTEAVILWELPFRFLPQLWRQPQDLVMTVLAVAGGGWAWRSGSMAARAVAVYAVVYFLTYSCALQSLHPPRPMVRDGDRFLASLAFPLSILASHGCASVCGLLLPRLPARWASWMRRVPWLGITGLAAMLIAVGDRPAGGHDYLREVGQVVRAQRPGSIVVSHPPMRAVAQLAAPDAAERLEWRIQKQILLESPELDAALEGADAVWLIRKHAWIVSRKQGERGALEVLPRLAPFLAPPFDGWWLDRSVLKGDVPDFLFFRRSQEQPRPLALPDQMAPGPLPRDWNVAKDGDWFSEPVEIPASLRGVEVFLSARYASAATEPIRLRLEFFGEKGEEVTLTFKPYLLPKPSADFFAFRVPEWAVRAKMRIRAEKGNFQLADLEPFVFLSR